MHYYNCDYRDVDFHERICLGFGHDLRSLDANYPLPDFVVPVLDLDPAVDVNGLLLEDLDLPAEFHDHVDYYYYCIVPSIHLYPHPLCPVSVMVVLASNLIYESC